MSDLFTIQRSIERRNRIILSISAYSYEYESYSMITDEEYDSLSLRIDKDMETLEDYYDNERRKRVIILDNFFKNKFDPHTGMWISKHPEFNLVKKHYLYCREDLELDKLCIR